ncbi:unnamed protein product [Dibothriocephalus latus]|uniref:Uncharacterized protein n=1 Tax=Dibothriocephalus latus TaxID=60516 RepID=A0A3P7P1L5_DIBLA|nr:unnamed protein product [Dibothriocephalus latus]
MHWPPTPFHLANPFEKSPDKADSYEGRSRRSDGSSGHLASDSRCGRRLLALLTVKFLLPILQSLLRRINRSYHSDLPRSSSEDRTGKSFTSLALTQRDNGYPRHEMKSQLPMRLS